MSDAPDEGTEIVFLTVEVVVALHQRQLDRYGGGAGLRDRGLLESAVAQAQASFGDGYVHPACSQWLRRICSTLSQINRSLMETSAQAFLLHRCSCT